MGDARHARFDTQPRFSADINGEETAGAIGSGGGCSFAPETEGDRKRSPMQPRQELSHKDIRKSLVGSMCTLHTSSGTLPNHKRSIAGGLPGVVPEDHPKSFFRSPSRKAAAGAPAPANPSPVGTRPPSKVDSPANSFTKKVSSLSPGLARFARKVSSEDNIGAGTSADSFKKRRLTEAEGDAFAREVSRRKKHELAAAQPDSPEGADVAPTDELSTCAVLFYTLYDSVSDLTQYALPSHARGPVNRYGFDRLVIHPENRVKRAFDVLVALSVVYVARAHSRAVPALATAPVYFVHSPHLHVRTVCLCV